MRAFSTAPEEGAQVICPELTTSDQREGPSSRWAVGRSGSCPREPWEVETDHLNTRGSVCDSEPGELQAPGPVSCSVDGETCLLAGPQAGWGQRRRSPSRALPLRQALSSYVGMCLPPYSSAAARHISNSRWASYPGRSETASHPATRKFWAWDSGLHS